MAVTSKQRGSFSPGAIMVDVLMGASFVLLLTSGIFFILCHLWGRVYLETESFYLARARLYQNTKLCRTSDWLVPQSWLARDYNCNGTSIQASYKILPSFHRKKIRTPFRMQLTREIL